MKLIVILLICLGNSALTQSKSFQSNNGAESSTLRYTLTEERLKKIRSEKMYWFFDKGGDENVGDYQIYMHSSLPEIHKIFNFSLPFFGFHYKYIRLTMHGHLAFSDPPEQYTYPLVFPVKDWPKKNDPAFIGIFFSKCRIGQLLPSDLDRRKPGVYFRVEENLQDRADQFGIELRERVKRDLAEAIIGSDIFIPKHVVIATWKNVSFAGGIDSSRLKTNTFQIILATDEVQTYAIFNYLDIQWTSHVEAGGDTTDGEGGVPAYVGFNAGNGIGSYEYTPYSQTYAIRNLLRSGWSNGFPGRHVFRVDKKIVPATLRESHQDF